LFFQSLLLLLLRELGYPDKPELADLLKANARFRQAIKPDVLSAIVSAQTIALP
jgi:hypothetical protein